MILELLMAEENTHDIVNNMYRSTDTIGYHQSVRVRAVNTVHTPVIGGHYRHADFALMEICSVELNYQCLTFK